VNTHRLWTSITFLVEGCTRWPLSSLLASKVRFYSRSFSALCLLIPWGYILRSLLPSPYAASNTDSLDPGWTGCYWTSGLQKTPGHFLPTRDFPNSADPLWTPQVMVKRSLSFFCMLNCYLFLLFLTLQLTLLDAQSSCDSVTATSSYFKFYSSVIYALSLKLREQQLITPTGQYLPTQPLYKVFYATIILITSWSLPKVSPHNLLKMKSKS